MTTLCILSIAAICAFAVTFVLMSRPQRHWSEPKPNVPPRQIDKS
jgi:hypothetical protein